MGVYLVGYDIDGYEVRDIEDEVLIGSGNTVVIVLSKDIKERLNVYYRVIKDIILNNNKLVLIVLGDRVKEIRQLCNLAVSYGCYNIYNVLDTSLLDKEYIDKVVERNGSYEEVQTFIGSDVTAYSDISTILLGIEELVRSKDIEGLKVFLSRHINNIKHLISTFDYMKGLINVINTDELINKINKLSIDLERTNNKLNELGVENRNLSELNNKLKGEIEKLKNDLKFKDNAIEDLKEQLESKSPIIRAYKEINTSLIKCRTDVILYFKEITKIPYINSFIVSFIEILKSYRLNVKLLIYDRGNKLSILYKPLNVVNSSEYLSKRDAFKKHIDKFVVIEPNPVILEDILTYSDNPYNVVVVYDRLGQEKDIVAGNNVYKYYVINSKTDYNSSKDVFKIDNKSHIITRENSSIGNEVLDIPTIDGYSKLTDTAKMSRYLRAVTSASKKPLVDDIMNRARIKTLLSSR